MRNKLTGFSRTAAAKALPRYPLTTLAWLLVSAGCAYAYSGKVMDACKADYYQHCSQFSVGTEELRQCMRKVGEGLSTPCLVALVQEGEITKAEVDNYNARHSGKASAPETGKDVKVASTGSTKHAADDDVDGAKPKKTKAGKTPKAANASGLKAETSKVGKTAALTGSGKTGKKSKIAGKTKGAATVATLEKTATTTKVKKSGSAAETKKSGKVQKLASTGKPAKAKKSKQTVATQNAKRDEE